MHFIISQDQKQDVLFGPVSSRPRDPSDAYSV